MRRTTIAAALFGVAFSGEALQAQDWGGAAGVAALRGYTASPGIAMTSYDGGLTPIAAQPPADEEAHPSIGSGGPAAVADAAAPAPHPRRRAAGTAPYAGTGRSGHHRRRHRA